LVVINGPSLISLIYKEYYKYFIFYFILLKMRLGSMFFS
jgi:hypothetical protein